MGIKSFAPGCMYWDRSVLSTFRILNIAFTHKYGREPFDLERGGRGVQHRSVMMWTRCTIVTIPVFNEWRIGDEVFVKFLGKRFGSTCYVMGSVRATTLVSNHLLGVLKLVRGKFQLKILETLFLTNGE